MASAKPLYPGLNDQTTVIAAVTPHKDANESTAASLCDRGECALFITFKLRSFAWKLCLGIAATAFFFTAVVLSQHDLERDTVELHPLATRGKLTPMGEIAFRLRQTVTDGWVEVVPPVSGRVTIDGNRIRFQPEQPFRPGSVYTFYVHFITESNEKREERFVLEADSLFDTIWVYAKLDSHRHQVQVFRGDHLVRSMLASGGRSGHETPGGVYRIQNRGYHFFSQKYGEGAYYWVRIFGNYLFHSLPVDIEGQIIEEEARKLGCPASHGCIRLSFPDAQWFYEHVPDGTLVVIDVT